MNSPTLFQWIADQWRIEGTTDICIDGDHHVFMDRLGKRLQFLLDGVSAPRASSDEIKRWVIEQLSRTAKSWDAKSPFVDTTLPEGIRLHAVFSPISRTGTLVSLRKLSTPQAVAWMTDPHFDFLRDRVHAGESMIISGATGSGKTTLAQDLLSFVDPSERIIGLEDTPELSPLHPGFLTLLSRPPNADGFGEITLRQLLKQTLRMRPDRIILGECRGEEVLDLLQILNTGHQGALATIHAKSARDSIRRLEILALLGAKGTVPITVIRDLIAHGVQWLAFVERSGARSISEILKVEGKEGDTLLTRTMLKSEHGKTKSQIFNRATRPDLPSDVSLSRRVPDLGFPA